MGGPLRARALLVAGMMTVSVAMLLAPPTAADPQDCVGNTTPECVIGAALGCASGLVGIPVQFGGWTVTVTDVDVEDPPVEGLVYVASTVVKAVKNERCQIIGYTCSTEVSDGTEVETNSFNVPSIASYKGAVLFIGTGSCGPGGFDFGGRLLDATNEVTLSWWNCESRGNCPLLPG